MDEMFSTECSKIIRTVWEGRVQEQGMGSTLNVLDGTGVLSIPKGSDKRRVLKGRRLRERGLTIQ